MVTRVPVDMSLSYTSWASFVADLPTRLVDFPEGRAVDVAGVRYLKMLPDDPQYGTDPIPTAPGYRFADSSVMDFHDYEFISLDQMAHVRNNDVDAQDATEVTAGVQAMMEAAMAFVEAGGSDDRTARIVCRGKFAMNDEMFSEDFAEILWTITSGTHSRFIFDLEGATFQAKGWPSHKAVRTSGFYGEQSIADAVPTVMFRWEQKTKRGLGPHIIGGTFAGERLITDPIGMKLRNVNRGNQSNVEIRDFLNVGRWVDDVNNSDFFGTVVSRCGYQPTQAGGTGFVSSTVRIATTAGAGTTTAVATEAIFDAADHVGKWLMIEGAGEGGTDFAAQISSVDSTTQVTLDRQCTTNVTGSHVSFVMLEGSVTASSTTLTLATDVTDDLIGRYVMVYKAGSTVHDISDSSEDVLVTRVTAQAGKVLTLATPARYTVSDTPVAIAPTTFLGKCDDQVQADGVTPESGHNNDCQFVGERVEYSFDQTWGGAVSEVAQAVLATQFIGRKTHGTSAGYNNFGGNGMNRWLDNCKFYNSIGEQLEWGDWHPTKGRVCVLGERSMIYFNGVNIGGFQTLDFAAELFIDPLSTSRRDCRVALSGFRNTPPGLSNLANQDNIRLGANGQTIMVTSAGPFVSRDADGYPDMPRTNMSGFDLWGITPSGVYRDTNDGTRFRQSLNSGRFSFEYDDNDDGVYDQGGFGWSATNGFEIDEGSGWEGVFERGSFTPTLEFGGVEISTLGGAYSNQQGRYMRILNRVFVRIAITLSAKGTATGDANVTVPSSLEPANYNEYLGAGRYNDLASLGGNVFGATLGAGLNAIRLRHLGSTTAYGELRDTNFTDTSRIEISGWYEIA